MIGVIGGRGPLATAEFLNKVIAATPAEDDEQQVPLLVSCDPRIPRRPVTILQGGESPLPRLRDIRDRLIQAGATAWVMPCNTAHHWHAELQRGCGVPFPSIIDIACDAAASRTPARCTHRLDRYPRNAGRTAVRARPRSPRQARTAARRRAAMTWARRRKRSWCPAAPMRSVHAIPCQAGCGSSEVPAAACAAARRRSST